MINLSVSQGMFHCAWKSSVIVPILKIGDPQSSSNYRPINILRLVSKVARKLMAAKITKYLNKSYFDLHPIQFGFRANYSTEMANCYFTEKVKSLLVSWVRVHSWLPLPSVLSCLFQQFVTARWALFFGWFRFTISYRPGSKNGKPDALSQIFEAKASPTLPVPILPHERVVAAVTWGVESKVRTALRGTTIPAGCPEGLLFVPESVRTSVLLWGHSSGLACHPGATRTCMLIKQRFWWPSVARDARMFVSAGPVCAAGKGSNRPPAGLLQLLSVPSRPWYHIAMDFVTGLPPVGWHDSSLTVVDRFSKAAHFIPLPKLPSARETATVVLDHVFRIHGLPVNVVSDRGPQFVSRFWTEFCRQLGATASLSSGYHPQTNGQAERANEDLERVLRCVASAEPSSCSSRLTMVEYVHNFLPVSSTGLSPFQCCLGYQPPLFPSQESDAIVPSVHAFIQRCLCTWRTAREALTQTGKRNKASADLHRTKPPLYVCGQKVWLSSQDLPFRLLSRKLGPKFVGTFIISKVLSPVSVRLKLTPPFKNIHPVFHVSKIKPVIRSPFQPQTSSRIWHYRQEESHRLD